MNYEELLPCFESSTSWSDHKEVYEKSSCRFHQVLFGRPYVCTVDDLTSPIPKGLVLFLKYNVLVSLFLRFPGRGKVVDAVTVNNHHGRTSLT